MRFGSGTLKRDNWRQGEGLHLMQMEGRVPSCSLSTFLWGSGRLEELKKKKRMDENGPSRGENGFYEALGASTSLAHREGDVTWILRLCRGETGGSCK